MFQRLWLALNRAIAARMPALILEADRRAQLAEALRQRTPAADPVSTEREA